MYCLFFEILDIGFLQICLVCSMSVIFDVYQRLQVLRYCSRLLNKEKEKNSLVDIKIYLYL